VRRPLYLYALVGLASGAFLAACEDGTDILLIEEPSSTLLVETNADEGEGTLRAALETASSDPEVNSIQVEPGLGTLSLSSSLEYSGNQALRIVGNGLVVDGSGCGCDLLISSGGGDLELLDLTLTSGRVGLLVSVPGSAANVVSTRLTRVTAEDNGGHGVYVMEAGSGGSAGIRVELASSMVRRNGFGQGTTDQDGVRVEEKGEGNLVFVAAGFEALENSGDGVDLREEGGGDLVADVQDSSFDENGEEPQSTAEVEDGFDAWEQGPGSLDVRILNGTAVGNYEQGVELTESGAGDLRASLTRLTATDNRGDNILLREDLDAQAGTLPGAGGIIATLTEVLAQDADDDGAQIQEFGAGDLNVQVQDGDFSDNADDGLSVLQDGTGHGRLHLVRVVTERNGGLPITSRGTAVTEGDDQTTTVRVRSTEDTGFGTLRAALELANEDPGVSTILFETGIGVIEIDNSLEYTGSQDLRIVGSQAVVDGEGCDCDALVVSGGGDLTLEKLVIRNAEGNGIFMEIPADATDLVTVTLREVGIRDNGLHGFHIDDLADENGTGGNSAAGILLDFRDVSIQANGFRQDITDRDGLRVEEGGSGGIELRAERTFILGNAGDGVELKETGLGEVVVDIRLSRIDNNGSQPQNPDNLEDGLDIREAGPGAVRLDIRGLDLTATSIEGNGNRGIRIREEGSGDVMGNLDRILASGNGNGLIFAVEDADSQGNATGGSGCLDITFNQVVTEEGERDGVHLEEFGLGYLSVTARGLDASLNGGDGLWARENGVGDLLIEVRDSFFDSNGQIVWDPDDLGAGMQLLENGAGVLDVRLVETSLSQNPDGGLDAEEEGSGDLRGTLTAVEAVGNGQSNVRLVEDADASMGTVTGSGSLYVAFTELTSTGSLSDGVHLAEYSEGDFTGQITLSAIRGNRGDGIDATQGGVGTGQLHLVSVDLSGNSGEGVVTEGVTVTGG